MRIGDFRGDSNAARLNKTQQELSKLQEKLATGKAINRASDDAAGLAMAKEFEKQVRANRTASENISAGMSALEIADGGGAVITDMLQRQRELALQSQNDTLNNDQRAALDREYQSLSQEIDRVAQSTNYNGLQLLNGQSKLSDGTGKLQVGEGSGAEDQVNLNSSDLSAASLNLTGSSIANSNSASSALNTIDTALKQVTGQRSNQGALVNRLSYAESNNQTGYVNTSKTLSQIEDMDMAQGVTEQVRLQLLGSSGSAALQSLNQISRNNLIALLQG